MIIPAVTKVMSPNTFFMEAAIASHLPPQRSPTKKEATETLPFPLLPSTEARLRLLIYLLQNTNNSFICLIIIIKLLTLRFCTRNLGAVIWSVGWLSSKGCSRLAALYFFFLFLMKPLWAVSLRVSHSVIRV